MMSVLTDNAFTSLTFIAAPAVLTNASSVLALGTSNRFARAVDRARELARRITDSAASTQTPEDEIMSRMFERMQLRTLFLIKALRCFYTALGCFASSALVSLIGACVYNTQHHLVYLAAIALGLIVGTCGVGSMVYGSTLLVRETQLTVVNLSEEAAVVRAETARLRRMALATRREDPGDA